MVVFKFFSRLFSVPSHYQDRYILRCHGQLYQNAKRLLWPSHSMISPYEKLFFTFKKIVRTVETSSDDYLN
jgi:hypothetical protein